MTTMAYSEVPVGGAIATMPTRSHDDEFADYMRVRQQSLLRTAYLLTGDADQAQDLAQVALTKLYQSWDKVRDPAARDGYVRRIMVNENNSSWRRPWRRREISTSTFADTAHAPTTDPDTRGAVWDLVQTLPAKQRTVIVLRYYEGMSVAEIADVMGTSTGTVKSQASRAIATLRVHPGLADLEDWS